MNLSKIFSTKRSYKLLQGFVVFWVAFTVPLFSIAQPVNAQTAPTETQPKYYYDSSTNQFYPVGTKPPSATNSATAEDGEVLGHICFLGSCAPHPDVPFVDVPDPRDWIEDIPGVSSAGDIIGVLKDIFERITQLPFNIAKSLLSWIFENLFQALIRIILYITHIIASALGFSAERACDNTDDPKTGFDEEAECRAHLNTLAKIDPLFADTSGFSAKYNLFTLADASMSSMYGSFTGGNTTHYLASTFNENVLGVQTANAQGRGTELIGYDAVKTAWSKIRDLTYIAMVLILVVIGFMVMFRKKLDPRTVVTATNSLPKVGLALILITFSFAIAGLFFDLIFLLDNVVRVWFSGLDSGWDDMWGLLGTAGLKFVSTKWGGEFVWLPFFTLFSASIIKPTFLIVITVAAGGLGAVVGGFLGAAIGVLLGYLIAVIGYLLFEIMIRLSMFIIAVILFWTLFMRYVTMIALVIFGPVFFLIGAIPGFEGLTISWLKRMLANAIVFPITLLFVYLAVSFLSPDIASVIRWSSIALGPIGAVSGSILDYTWNPAGGGGAPPGLGGGSFFLNIPALIGLGFILFAIKVPGFIDEVFGLKDPFGRNGLGIGLLFAPIGLGLGGARAMQKNSAPIMAATGSVGTALASKTGDGFMAKTQRAAGQGLGKVHDFARAFSGNTNRFDATGDPSKTYSRTFQEKLQGQYNVKNARGAVVRSGMDAAERAKDSWVEAKVQEIHNINIAAGAPNNPVENRQKAEEAWRNNFSSATGAPSLAPDRSGSNAEIVQALNKHADELRARGMAERDIDAALQTFIKNGFKP
jgi:hypothetical protein